MILLTELSTKAISPDLISDGQGVWRYSFGGDETYIDDLGAEFYWSGRKDIFQIRGVVYGTDLYTETFSVADCRAQSGSFYWDDANTRVYIHHTDEANDYAKGRAIYRIFEVSAGYATGRYDGQLSYYPDFYFDPRITEINDLQKRVDPLKFGLLSFESSSYQLGNADGVLDDFSLSEALNSQVRFVLMDKGQTDIDDGERIFTGYTGGSDRDDRTLRVRLQEARTFYDRSVCPNVFTTDDFANLDDKYDGKRIPVAYGKIRRGIAVPIDTASFDKDTGGTVTFKLADDSLFDILAVDALYDNDGNSVTFGTVNLSDCTVRTTIAADADVDLSRFSWEGQGYDIPGTYNNGLDIMKSAFVTQGELAYLASTFDTTQWDAQTTEQNESVGLSIQSDRGIVGEIIEPITVSLQGIVDILGDGRITFIPRDPTAAISRTIRKDEMIEAPDFEIETEETVSIVEVRYSPSFVDDDDSFRTRYTDDRTAVTAAYGVDSSQPVSPVKTVLTEEADALALGEEVASTSSDPQSLVSLTIPLTANPVGLFDIVQVDVGRVGVEAFRVYEVLERTLGIQNGELIVRLGLRDLPDRTPDLDPATAYDEGLYSESAESTLDEGAFDEQPNYYLNEGTYV